MIFTKDNYFLNTQGKWKYIGDIDFKIDTDFTRWYINIEDIEKQVAELLGIKRNRLILNYESSNWHWGSHSVYFEIKNSNKIVRVSNHWSKTNSKNNNYKIKECFNIRSCFWELKVKNKEVESNSYFQAAIISSKDFKEWNY